MGIFKSLRVKWPWINKRYRQREFHALLILSIDQQTEISKQQNQIAVMEDELQALHTANRVLAKRNHKKAIGGR